MARSRGSTHSKAISGALQDLRRVPRHRKRPRSRFGTILALLAAVFVTALWAQPAQSQTGPTVTITGVPKITQDPYNATFTFSEAVTGFVAADITAGQLSVSNFSGSGKTYTAKLTPDVGGGVAPAVYRRTYLRVSAGRVSAGVAQNTGGVDNQASSLYETRHAPRTRLTMTGVPATATGAFTATFEFNKNIRHGQFTLSDIQTTNATATNLTRTSGSGTFGKKYTATITSTGGDFTVKVPQDAVPVNTRQAINSIDLGNTAASANGTYTCTSCPGVTSIEREAPADERTKSDTLKWKVTFDEDVQNVNAADFTITGTTATLAAAAVVESGTTSKKIYDVTASGGNLAALDATVTLGFASDQDITDDPDDNALTNTTPTGDNDNTYIVDNTVPSLTSITRQIPTVTTTDADELTWRVTFSEQVWDVEAAHDFSVTITPTPATAPTLSVARVGGFDFFTLP